MSDMFARLAAEFPREAIHWRAQTLTGDGTKALALAYLDARDVMDRLDDACTPGGWQNECFETAKGRMIGKISILVDGQWISKCDGAGDTDVEGEKGGISDALKRAAVLWGIGRYLYRLPAVWAPCTTYEKGGKKYWKAWNGSPWDHIPGARKLTPMIDDADAAQILTLAQATGISIQTICERANVSAIDEMTADAGRSVIRKLNLTLADLNRKKAA